MFVVMEMQTDAQGTLGTFVWSFADRAQAEAKYHSVLAAAAVSALPLHGAVLLRGDGVQLAYQSYAHGE